MAVRPKACVCCRSLAGIAGSNPTGGLEDFRCECLCCQVDVAASD